MNKSANATQYILRIAGINHKDPAMRQRLIEWLARCSTRFGQPDFVAVEWDMDVFESVKAKREEFRCLLRNEWPNFSESVLDTLMLSLGYEGDAHVAIYPTADTLWLDQGRKDYPRNFVAKCAAWRFRDYKKFLDARPGGSDDSAILCRISEGASVVAAPQYGTRDRKWAELIAQATAQGINNWAIAIVGNDHAVDDDGSMRRILEETGYACKHVPLIGR